MLVALVQFASVPTASGHNDEPHQLPDAAVADSGANPLSGIPLEAVDHRWWEGEDFLVTARPSANGYSLLIGWERQKYAFRPLATIQPGGYGDDVWLGYHCLTGDRKHVVVSLLPRWAVSRQPLRDRGALVYVVTVATGEVRPLVRGVAFKQHAVGCGAGSRLAMLRHLDTDQARTELLVADAAEATVRSVGTFEGQLTWPVSGPGDRVLALQKSAVVAATGGRPSLETVTRVAGEAYNLVATSNGRLSFLTLNQDRVAAFELAGRRTVEVGSGPADQVRLVRAATRGAFFGLDRIEGGPVAPAATPTAPGAAGDPPRRLLPETVSAAGKVVLAATAARQDVEATRRVAMQRRPDLSNEQFEPIKRLFWASSGQMLHGQSPQGRSGVVVEAVPAPDGSGRPGVASTTPTCGVPRNEPRRTAYGATNVQASWAVEMASRELLAGQNARPANYLSSGLPAYSPSVDFDLPALRPAGGNVPPVVMNAILAQESAYRQASRRTLPGSGGNPVIADYYGANGTLDIIDYANADCGYGIAQVTTGMRASETSISPNGKAKVAIDYAENIQAGMNILTKKWNQLYESNIRLNDSNPAYVENWYFALWAYNSGVQPDARFGNTSGCTPSPTCTDQYGNWGLGWTNNPRNSDYPPTRSVFLRDTYADAEHPSDWPYQERILGWAETPVKNFRGDPAYEPAVAGPGNPTGAVVTYPNRLAFCTASNSCDPTATTGEGCRRTDFRCWWHDAITVFPTCANTCARSPFTWAVDSREPAGENPWRPECDSHLGPGAVIVDDLNDPSANIFCPNRNWQNRGTFTYTVGSNTSGAPLGIIDFHQVATGLGAHTWFAGNRVANDTAHRVTGVWRPTNLAAGTYVVKAHIPTAGAGTESAVYKVTTVDGSVRQRTINQHEHYNHWKTIGVYQLGPNAQVELTNVTAFDTEGGKGTVAWDAVAFVPAPGRYEEQSVEVYAQFDEDTNLDVNAPASWIAGMMRSRQALYDWATGVTGGMLNLPSCSGPPTASCLMAQTRTAMTRWRQDVLAAGTDPVNHPDGTSIPTWLALANDYRDRPTTTTKPTHFDHDNDVHKIKTKATVSYVVGQDGRIVEGSEDVVYQHRTGDTHLPDFIRSYLGAIATDYGVRAPDLEFTAPDLNVHNHQWTTATPNVNGLLPGRAYAAAGKRPVVTNYDGRPAGSATERNCVAALYVSGGTIGYRPMMGVGYVSTEVEAWMQRVHANPGIPDAVAALATDIYETFFKVSGVVPAAAVLFEYAPPIWQELNFQVCIDGSIRHLNRPILRASFMPHQYLYHQNRAIDVAGSPATSAAPVMTGDFQPFSNPPAAPPWLPLNYDNPFGGCDSNTGRRGNPWNMMLQGGAAFNPTHVHFCVDASLPTDPDYG